MKLFLNQLCCERDNSIVFSKGVPMSPIDQKKNKGRRCAYS